MRSLRSKSAADAHHVRCAYPNPSVQLLRTDRVRGDSLIPSTPPPARFLNRNTFQRAGIGINAGRIRALQPGFVAAKPSTPAVFRSQALPDGGEILLAGRRARRRVATLFYPMWHPEVESSLR